MAKAAPLEYLRSTGRESSYERNEGVSSKRLD